MSPSDSVLFQRFDSSLPSRLYARDVVKGMVPMTLLRVLSEYLQHKGVPPNEVLPPGVDIDAAGSNALARFPAEDYCQLLIQSAERLNDPYLGLHLGQHIRPAHLGALGYVLLACENLGQALMRMRRYHRLVNDINPLQYLINGEYLELGWGISHGKTGALFDESGVASIVHFAQDLCGETLPLAYVDFVNPAPTDVAVYQSYFGCQVRFDQPVTRLAIPLRYMGAPLRQADPALLRLMEDQVDTAMGRLPQPDDVVEVTQRLIAQLAPQGMPELQQVAGELRISHRVLSRKLAQKGASFRDLREAALKQLAELHLGDLRLTVSEVGAMLGYTEQSAFSRAFKRWTGLTPMQWRQIKSGC